MVQRTTRWLEENADSPAGLRRLVLEARDELLRSLRAKEAGSRADETGPHAPQAGPQAELA